jgi:hypothetical protein
MWYQNLRIDRQSENLRHLVPENLHNRKDKREMDETQMHNRIVMTAIGLEGRRNVSGH